MNFLWLIKYIIAGAGGVISLFLGGFDVFLYTLLSFMTLDYITGVSAAIKEKELSAQSGFWGIVRKLCALSMVSIAYFIDVYLLDNCSIVRYTVIFFYISNESISIFENTVRLGVPLPQKAKDVLKAMKGE